MGTLTALTLATPLFGLALTPPTVPPSTWVALAPAQVAAASSEGAEPQEDGASTEAPGSDTSFADYASALRERSALSKIHRPLGIATWAAMGTTLILGGIQYHNLYGFFSDLKDTPCVTGDAIFGQGQCSGTPWLHLSSSLLTGALYGATFAVSLLMPDPDDAAASDSDYGRTLRAHKLLRWIHFGGMIAQMALGIVVANSEHFGLDRANDFGTLQALGTVHMGLGLVTFGAMTWAAVLML